MKVRDEEGEKRRGLHTQRGNAGCVGELCRVVVQFVFIKSNEQLVTLFACSLFFAVPNDSCERPKTATPVGLRYVQVMYRKNRVCVA